jgi:hypothetical protein
VPDGRPLLEATDAEFLAAQNGFWLDLANFEGHHKSFLLSSDLFRVTFVCPE